MPKKICNQIGCDTLISMEHTYCDQHRKDVIRTKNKRYDDTNRNKDYAKFYKSSAWKKVRDTIMKRNGGLCTRCKQFDMITAADVVDHIIPISSNWDLRFTSVNLQPLCHSCHAKKTGEDTRKYGEGL